MRENKINILHEFLITQMNNLVFFPFGLTLAALFREVVPMERPSLFIWMIGGLIPFFLYFVRCKVKHFLPLLLIHLVSGGVLLMLSGFLSPMDSPVNRIYFMLVGIGFIIHSLYLRFVAKRFESEAFSMLFTVGFIAVSLFIQHYKGHGSWDSFYIASLIIILACFYPAFYLKKYLNFLKVNESSTGVLPEKEIFHSGIRLTFLYTFAAVFILICTAQFSWLKNILYGFLRILLLVPVFISRIIPGGESAENEISAESTGAANNSGMDMQALAQGAETAGIWGILEVIIVFVLAIGALFVLYFMLRRFIRFIKTAMWKGRVRNKEFFPENAVDVREKCEIRREKSSKKNSFAIFGFLDSKEKIRHIYKKTVSGYKPNPLIKEPATEDDFSPERLNFYTARELEKYLNKDLLAEIYEKARYSDEECTAQDVKLMKSICK